jgi:hypothetical protein
MDAEARVCGFAFGGIAAEEDHRSAKESDILTLQENLVA